MTDPASPHRVLLVGAGEVLPSSLAGLLADAGHEILIARNGEEALERARKDPPDLILLDLPPPGGESPGICRRLRSDPLTEHVPVLVVTARHNPGLVVESLDSGADDFISQPVVAEELLARVRAALRGKLLQDGLKQVGGFYLELFSRMGAAVTSPFRLDEELARILAHALEAVGARKGRLLLFDSHRNRMEVRAAAGEAHGDALETGREVAEGPPPPGVIRLPLVAREEPLGALEIDGRGLPPLPPDRQKLLEAVAAQTVMFVENVRLNREVRRMFLDIIVSLAGAVDAKDSYTHDHTVRVASVSLLLAHETGLPPEERESLLLAALLHDVGKIGVPDSILKKPAPLDDSERAVMQRHPEIGAQMLRHIRPLKEALPAIRHHHEHWDGSGYPEGLSGEDIPRMSRIILAADAFDALTSDRIYRRGVAAAVALEKMGRYRGRQFDPVAFDALARLQALLAEHQFGPPPDFWGALS